MGATKTLCVFYDQIKFWRLRKRSAGELLLLPHPPTPPHLCLAAERQLWRDGGGSKDSEANFGQSHMPRSRSVSRLSPPHPKMFAYTSDEGSIRVHDILIRCVFCGLYDSVGTTNFYNVCMGKVVVQ